MTSKDWVKKDWNDHQFAEFLRGKSENWKPVQTGGNAVSFVDEKDVVIAFALYNNSNSTFQAFIPE